MYAVANGLALTSASAYLSFDEQVFALVPASFAADGTVQPFVRGAFLPGQVYENSTAGDAEGGNGLTGFQLNYVAVSGSGEKRSTGEVTRRGGHDGQAWWGDRGEKSGWPDDIVAR